MAVLLTILCCTYTGLLTLYWGPRRDAPPKIHFYHLHAKVIYLMCGAIVIIALEEQGVSMSGMADTLRALLEAMRM